MLAWIAGRIGPFHGHLFGGPEVRRDDGQRDREFLECRAADFVGQELDESVRAEKAAAAEVRGHRAQPLEQGVAPAEDMLEGLAFADHDRADEVPDVAAVPAGGVEGAKKRKARASERRHGSKAARSCKKMLVDRTRFAPCWGVGREPS